MGSYKVVHHVIKELQEAGFTATVKRPGEYPLVEFRKGNGSVKIDFETGDIEGVVSPRAFEDFVRCIRFYVQSTDEPSKSCEKLVVNGKLRSNIEVRCGG